MVFGVFGPASEAVNRLIDQLATIRIRLTDKGRAGESSGRERSLLVSSAEAVLLIS